MFKKKDVLFKLAAEIDAICHYNNLNYTLCGKLAVALLESTELDDEQIALTIAMTQGDAEKLENCIQKNIKNGQLSNRFIESKNTNKQLIGNYMIYGDLNTVTFNPNELAIRKSTNRIYDCIALRIIFISKDLQSLYKDNTDKLAHLSILPIKGYSLWYVRFAKQILNFFTKLFKGKTLHELKQKQYRERFFIDSWNNIFDHTNVNIGTLNLPSSVFSTVKRYELDKYSFDVSVGLKDYLKELVQNENEMNLDTGFFSTYMSYEEYKKNAQIQQLKNDIALLNEKVINKNINTFLLRRKMKRFYDLVRMSKDKIQLGEYYIGIQSELFSTADREKLKDLMRPYTESLKIYERKKMTWSINKEIDELAYEILKESGGEKVVKHIKKLKNKRYFIK